MRNFLAGSLAATALSIALGGTALADTDPTVHQIYEAAASDHLDQAQQMMDQVLHDHPRSAKAHYVQSELYAREGKLTLARAELERAEQLEPGLPKEDPRSVAELKSELGLTGHADRSSAATGEPASHFPWLTVVILALVVGAIWLLFRRARSAQGPQDGAPTPMSGPSGPGGGYAAPGSNVPVTPPSGGGVGSAVAGGLAGGLAAGAGVVAGEALAHHLLDGGRPSASGAEGSDSSAANADMGGADFGVKDPGSWDDDSNDGGGGGNDWT